jgi:TonB family protein
MKPTTGSAKSRRTAAPKSGPKPAPKARVRLDLKRRPEPPEPEEEIATKRKSHFWRWVALVALFHVLVIAIVSFVYEMAPAQKPPEQFISLLPQGDTVKGTAGTQAAHKVGPSTPAPSEHHSSTPPPPTHAEVKPPKPVEPRPAPVKPTPKIEPPAMVSDKPILLPKPVPPPPKPPKPKVKVDLTLADGPTTDKPVTKPKEHKKPAVKPDESKADDDAEKATSSGLSKEEIAAKLGDKLDEAGVSSATHTGISGAANAHPNDFSDFYASIRDQVMSQWQSPNLADETAVNPIVQIYVEKDGHVPPDSVHLIQSSGNPTYDDSAVAAAKSLGYLHEPLPDGCSPVIPITFKLTR